MTPGPGQSGVFRMRRPQTLLSLCDGLGSWSQPYVDADYAVIRVDVKDGQDVRLFRLPERPIHGVLAAPPCTVFAGSGNRWKRTEAELREGLSVVDACLRLITAVRPVWWALENPVGKLVHYIGPARMSFDPFEYGGYVEGDEDAYTKRTCLWGEFTLPSPRRVPPVHGSKFHCLPPSADRAALRSVTPRGFAQAFFEANP